MTTNIPTLQQLCISTLQSNPTPIPPTLIPYIPPHIGAVLAAEQGGRPLPPPENKQESDHLWRLPLSRIWIHYGPSPPSPHTWSRLTQISLFHLLPGVGTSLWPTLTHVSSGLAHTLTTLEIVHAEGSLGLGLELEGMDSLPALQTLWIHYSEVHLHSLPRILGATPSLTSLDLTHSIVSGGVVEEWRVLPALVPSLVHLGIDGHSPFSPFHPSRFYFDDDDEEDSDEAVDDVEEGEEDDDDYVGPFEHAISHLPHLTSLSMGSSDADAEQVLPMLQAGESAGLRLQALGIVDLGVGSFSNMLLAAPAALASNLSVLELRGVFLGDSSVLAQFAQGLVAQGVSLRHLGLAGTGVSSSAVIQLAQAGWALESLDLRWTNVEDEALVALGDVVGPSLSAVHLRCCEDLSPLGVRALLANTSGSVSFFDGGRTSAVDDSVLDLLGPSLTSLDVSWALDVTDAGLRGVMARAASGLRFLSVQGCKTLTLAGFGSWMAASFPQLAVFDASWADAVVDDELKVLEGERARNRPVRVVFYHGTDSGGNELNAQGRDDDGTVYETWYPRVRDYLPGAPVRVWESLRADCNSGVVSGP